MKCGHAFAQTAAPTANQATTVIPKVGEAATQAFSPVDDDATLLSARSMGSDAADPDATLLSARSAQTTVLPTTSAETPFIAPQPQAETQPLEQLVAHTEALNAETENPAPIAQGAAPTTAMAPAPAASSSAPATVPLPNGTQATEVLPPTSGAPTGGAATVAMAPVPLPRTVESDNEAPEDPYGADAGTAAADNGSAAVPPIVPPGETSGAQPGQPSNGNGKSGANRKRTIIIVAAVCVVALAIAGGVYAFASRNHHETALSACTTAQTTLDQANDTLKKSQDTAKTATNTKSDQVSDPTAIDDLKKLTDTDVDANTDDDLNAANECSPDLTANILQQHADTLTQAADRRTTLSKKLNSGARAITRGKSDKLMGDSRSTLQNTTNDAQQLWSSSNGKVADAATRDALQQAINAAKKLLEQYAKDSDSGDSANAQNAADEMNKANANLKTAMSKVTDSVNAKQAADAKKKQDEARKKAEAAADKSRCSAIAGQYGMWQGSPGLTVSANCDATEQDMGSTFWSGTYVANSYKSNGDGTFSWSLSNGKTMTYYPSGTQAPAIKEFFQHTPGPDTSISYEKIQTSDGTPFVKG